MSLRAKAMDAVLMRLGYRFNDPQLFTLALTHASVAEGARRIGDNERLEFLGDRVLGLMIAEALMNAFPEANEGELSKRFHALVSRETCADIANQLELGQAIRLAAGETKQGGRINPSIIGNALEALLGAVYTDGGMVAVKSVFLPLWADAIAQSSNTARSNPKSHLQEWAAANGKALPTYSLVRRSGPDHAPQFTIAVTLDGFVSVEATGRSRQEAEKAAALILIEREKLIS
jgi:ribonuclease-3